MTGLHRKCVPLSPLATHNYQQHTKCMEQRMDYSVGN